MHEKNCIPKLFEDESDISNDDNQHINQINQSKILDSNNNSFQNEKKDI